MSVLINKQAAINKINERQRELIYCFGFDNDMVKIMDIAKSIVIAMPSAQSELIRCKDCMYYIDNRCYKIKALDDLRSSNDYCSRAERRIDE